MNKNAKRFLRERIRGQETGIQGRESGDDKKG